jgi:hypothetical protein
VDEEPLLSQEATEVVDQLPRDQPGPIACRTWALTTTGGTP